MPHDMTVIATPGIPARVDAAAWQNHHYGLPAARWESLSGQAFWVTGAGTGYGQAIAIALAAAGATVFLTGRRRDKLEDTRQQAARAGADSGKLIAIAADITDAASVTQAVQAIRRHTGSLHGLVNNAALPQPRPGPWPLADLGEEAWEQLLRTNVTAQWRVTRAALPLLSAGSGFRVVFMTSEAGWAYTPGFGPYNLSKAALNNLGGSWAAECATRLPQQDVQINVLVPGEARTEMNQGSQEHPSAVVCMTLLLLSHPAGGPNGRFFHRDGRHLTFAYATPHLHSLLDPGMPAAGSPELRTAALGAALRSRLRKLLPS